jgi:hypothetical protein
VLGTVIVTPVPDIKGHSGISHCELLCGTHAGAVPTGGRSNLALRAPVRHPRRCRTYRRTVEFGTARPCTAPAPVPYLPADGRISHGAFLYGTRAGAVPTGAKSNFSRRAPVLHPWGAAPACGRATLPGREAGDGTEPRLLRSTDRSANQPSRFAGGAKKQSRPRASAGARQRPEGGSDPLLVRTSAAQRAGKGGGKGGGRGGRQKAESGGERRAGGGGGGAGR